MLLLIDIGNTRIKWARADAQGLGEQSAAVHANWAQQDFIQQVLEGGPRAERVVIANVGGRVVDPQTEEPHVGEYTAGWIKRGPSGVIGTNKPDAAETVVAMLEDYYDGILLEPAKPSAADAEALIKEKQPRFVTYEDWQKIDAAEVAKGEAEGRIRVKLTTVEEMLALVGK